MSHFNMLSWYERERRFWFRKGIGKVQAVQDRSHWAIHILYESFCVGILLESEEKV